MGDELVYGIFGRSLEDVLDYYGYRSPPRVSSKLRGWRYRERPVEPEVSGRLPVSAIASDFCPTARDVYVRYVEGLEAPASLPMVSGTLYHNTLEAVVTRAKRMIYEGITPDLDIAKALADCADDAVEETMVDKQGLIDEARVAAEDLERVQKNMLRLWRFEAGQIAAAVAQVLSRSPYIGADSLVAHAIPLTMEHRVDGSRVGLSKQLSIDAFQAVRTMVMEMKTGKEREYHGLTLAGYALAFESAFPRQVNFGMLAYVRFPEDRSVPLVVRRVYPIDDGLRLRFLRARDRKLAIVGRRRDPELPPRCPSACGYFRICRG
ncbi:MAG: type I-A CRISPR-associated protein Cas4/Csa1 [Candidatus Hodarchaeaceae archaeon]|nr:type I-A CRISPR-associated protein Cas4/Csa1 [Candidatus Hodarchaeaceae archaeon]